jgi:acetyl esterase/lipase
MGSMKSAFCSMLLLSICCFPLVQPRSASADAPSETPLWPASAPGERGDIGEEHDTTKPTEKLIAGKPVIRLGNVSKPTITLHRPPPDKDTGAAILVCPGGGYHILAMDLEGTEVCDWLNSIGVTGVLLKYRVPKRAGPEKSLAALQDGQRAFGMLRHRAKEWGLDPKRLGVLGFSAGAHLSAVLSSGSGERAYPAVDEADQASYRPDFTILIYPAYLTVKENGDKIAPDVQVTTNTPPTFLAAAEDDPVRMENALFYTLALKQSKIPVELHIYPPGGHGYGLRPASDLVTTWPERAAEWMRSRGIVKGR